ncbi:MAG TPA: protease pro-enzyme activation domain-containing protein, partial [Chloroflexota bacterium]|nr:protease pro-enzyme activation domain-containing protein [Chloroflexota bacterium]
MTDRALGPVAPTAIETFAIVLKPRSEKAVTQFVAAVTNKNSAQYHQYLPRGAFGSRFGPSPATIARVRSVIEGDGLHAVVSSNHLMVIAHGSASQIEKAFGTGLESYHLATGGMGQATTGVPSLPSTIARSVTGIVGLDDLITAQPSYIIPRGSSQSHGFKSAKHGDVPSVAGAATPCSDAQQAAAGSGGLTDDQIANSYGAFGLYSQGDVGAGQHIAIFEQQPFVTSDIATFDTCYFGATAASQMVGRLSVVPVDGGELQPGPGSVNAEANLDIEDVSAIAPQAAIDVYETPNTSFGTLDGYTQIVNNDTDQVISTSWAVCEQLAQAAEPGLQQAENLVFQQAAAQGQTMFAAAGDTGNDSCNSFRLVPTPAGQNLLSLLDPASQPYVVSTGGTT